MRARKINKKKSLAIRLQTIEVLAATASFLVCGFNLRWFNLAAIYTLKEHQATAVVVLFRKIQ